MNLSVLSTLTGFNVTSPTEVIARGYNGSSQETAGSIIKTQTVNSICSGIVIAIERNPLNPNWCVTIEVDSQHWVRYCNLIGASLYVGATVKEKDLIGYSSKNLLQFEYCTTNKSKFPVRVGSKQLYKSDPTPILFGQVKLSEVI